MSEFGESLIKSATQALEIAKGTAEPGTYRITTYDENGKPTVVADFSGKVLAEIDAEIAAEAAAEKQIAPVGKSPAISNKSAELIGESIQRD